MGGTSNMPGLYSYGEAVDRVRSETGCGMRLASWKVGDYVTMYRPSKNELFDGPFLIAYTNGSTMPWVGTISGINDDFWEIVDVQQYRKGLR